MPDIDPDDRTILAWSLLALALSAGGLAVALGAISHAHMAGIADLCGSPAGHCLACYGAAVSLAVALITGCAGLSIVGSSADDPAPPAPDSRMKRDKARAVPAFLNW